MTMPSTAWTRAQWATTFLKAHGNLQPSALTVQFVVGWGTHEGSGGSLVQGATNTCNGNMLATCQDYPGATACNLPYCVKSYRSNTDGVLANVQALQFPSRYPNLVAALRFNDEKALGYHGSPMSAGIIGDLSTWVSGSRTARPDYAASVANAAGAKPGSDAGSSSSSSSSSPKGGTTTSSNKPPNTGNVFTDALAGILGQGTLAWIQNPMRIIKMLVGIMCIGLSIYLLVAPDAASAVSKVAPFLA